MKIHDAILSAINHCQSGNLEQSEAVCRIILKLQPTNFHILNVLGAIYNQRGNHDVAINYYKKALQINPDFTEAYNNLGNVLKEKEQLDEAIIYYKKAIRINPNYAEAYNNLGTAFREKRLLDEAITSFQKALELNPDIINAYINLGLSFFDKKLFDEAIDCYRKALEINPDYADALYNLGDTFLEMKQFDRAIVSYQTVLQFKPGLTDAYINLGIALQEKEQLNDAINSYLNALRIDSKNARAYYNLATVLKLQGQLDEAVSCYQKTLQLNPNLLEAYNNLGNSYKDQGNLDQAEKCYRNALSIKPDCSFCYSNLLLSTNYNPQNDAKTIFSEHLQFAKRFEEPLLSAISPHKNKRSLSRRLRIGYVSPDFRRHSVSYFIEPVLASHNKEQFEIFCYSDVLDQDDVTSRMQKYADHWSNIVGISDEKVAELIRNDKIDILVDLAGHTANNRMLLFARKPAPVQVSWIGYPATTGLSSMDYKIVDRYTNPPGITEQFYTEKLIRMPDSFLCYLPDRESPEVGNLPALTSGYITFGSFNNFEKVTAQVLALWVRILQSTPDSHLIIKTKSLAYRSTREYVINIFKQGGIPEDRIQLISWEPSTTGHLGTYNRIDIALDTFPYNGTTTTCEAMWMGVPVITLAGNTHASRVGMSLLSNIGLPEFIAKTPAEYIEIAVNLTKHFTRLKSLREGLRDMMSYSSLTNSQQFLNNLEDCYRIIWGKWCKASFPDLSSDYYKNQYG